MFKSLSEKSSRAQVQSVWRHNPLVGNWALTWTNQAMIPDSRRGKVEGELVPAFFVKNFNVILFLLKKWESFSHLHPHPKAFSLFSTRGPDPGSQKAAGQQRLSLTSITSVAVGQAQLRWTGEKNPFSSAEWVLHIPSFPHDNLHLPAKKKMPRKAESLFLLWHSWLQKDHVLVAEKAPSLSLLGRVHYSSELGKHFMIWFNSCLWNCFCQVALDYHHHKENSLLSTWSGRNFRDRS